jgi:RNA polymerase sigma factor (sigma-70 family)
MSDRSSVAACTGPSAPSTRDFNALLPTYRRLKFSARIRPMMSWAAQHSLEDDLDQLALIELDGLAKKFDPSVGTTMDQYVGTMLPVRLFSCLRALKSSYCDPVFKHSKNGMPRFSEAFHNDLDAADSSEENAHVFADNAPTSFESEPDRSQVQTEKLRSRQDTAWDAHRHESCKDDAVFEELLRCQMAVRLRAAIECLPVRQSQIVLLMLEDCTDGEIANRLGITKQAVSKSRLLAIAHLKETMGSAVQ